MSESIQSGSAVTMDGGMGIAPAPVDQKSILQGWSASVALHIFVAAAVVLGAQQVAPIVKEPPFRWEVAMVTPPAPAEPAPPTPQPQVQPVTPPPQPKRQAVRPPQPVSEPTPQVVTREVATRVEPQAVERVVTPVERVAEPIQRTVEPVAQERPAVQEQVVREQVTPQPVEQRVPETSVQAVQQAAPVQAIQSMDVQSPTVVAQAAPVVTTESASSAVQHTVVETAAPSIVERTEAAAVVETAAPVERPAPPAPPVAPPAPVVEAAPPSPPIVAAAPAQLEEHQVVARVVPEKRTPSKADYAWLAESLHRRIVELRHYPSTARLNGWEGKVVLRVTLRQDGELQQVEVVKSSGYESLDTAAVEAVRRACPLHMQRQVHAPTVVVNVPIQYSLGR